MAETVSYRADTKEKAQNFIERKIKEGKAEYGKQYTNKFHIEEVPYDTFIDYRVIETYERRKMADGGMMAKGGKTDCLMILRNNESGSYLIRKFENHKGETVASKISTKSEAINKAKELSKKFNLPIEESYKTRLADGGMMEKGEVKKIVDGDNVWYLTYLDSTHFFLSNTPEYKGNAYHIGEFRNRPFYKEIEQWMDGITHKKMIERGFYADGGMMDVRREELNSYSDEKIARIYSDLKGIDYSDMIIELKGNKAERQDAINEIMKENKFYGFMKEVSE
jgi:hypothetical protein